jgi:sarcosine oxidase subunit gamma
MSDPILEQSPLWYLASRPVPAKAAASCVRYWENALQGHINLRGNASDPAFRESVARVLGTALPTAPNTTSAGEHCTAYWLGPDEWLVVTPGEREAGFAAGLRKALEGIHASVTEVSGGQTILVLRGAAVRDLLAKGSPFDLHAPAFAPGACAQTHLAKAAVLLRPLPDDGMEIIVRRSFADYLWSWLEVAAAEYGLAPGAERSSQGDGSSARHDAVQVA